MPAYCTLCKTATPPFKVNGQTLVGTLMKPYAICMACYNKAVPNGFPEKVSEGRRKLMNRVMRKLKSG